jgi:hypothetical protein
MSNWTCISAGLPLVPTVTAAIVLTSTEDLDALTSLLEHGPSCLVPSYSGRWVAAVLAASNGSRSKMNRL